MSDDILSRIDEIVEAATSCLCGCQKALRGGGDSPWFASEECQAAWNARRFAGKGKSSIEKVPVPASAPATVAEAVIRRMSRPHAASPWLTREDITGQRDRINDAFRAVVREQGLDEETIRIEALRPVRRPSVTVATPEEAARATGRHRIRSLECGALTASLRCSGCDGLAMEGGGCCWCGCHDRLADAAPAMSECPDDSNIATRPRWWQWRRRTHD